MGGSNNPQFDDNLKKYMSMIIDQKKKMNIERAGVTSSYNGKINDNKLFPSNPKYSTVDEDGVAQAVESNRTIAYYMLNLLCMVLMCILVFGILIIYFVIYLEGTLYINPMILVHLVIPIFVLIVNIYVILLEDHEEQKFFKKGNGFAIMNIAFLFAIVALGISTLAKVNKAQMDPADDAQNDSTL